MVMLESITMVELKEPTGKVETSLLHKLLIHLFQVSIPSTQIIWDFGNPDHVTNLISDNSTLVIITELFMKDKRLNILLQFYILMIVQSKVKSWDWSNNISSALPLSEISLEDTRRPTQTGITSMKRIKFNLTTLTQLLLRLNCLEFWLMRRNSLGIRLGTLFIRHSLIPIIPCFQKP